MEYICVYNIYIYICITESLCCTAEINFVNQLYFNKIFFNGDDVNLPHMVVGRVKKSQKEWYRYGEPMLLPHGLVST